MSLCVGAHSCWSILNFKIHFSPSCWTFYIITSHLLAHIALCPVQVLFFATAVLYPVPTITIMLITQISLLLQYYSNYSNKCDTHLPHFLLNVCLVLIQMSFKFCEFPWLVLLFSYVMNYTYIFFKNLSISIFYAYSINF